MSVYVAIVALLASCLCASTAADTADNTSDAGLVWVTVATEETDGFLRFMRSAKIAHIPITVLGMGELWRGGDIKRSPGGGHKVNLLRTELRRLSNSFSSSLSSVGESAEPLVMFTDSYDVLVTAVGAADIVRRFREQQARVLFSAEPFCWPNVSLAHSYPLAPSGGHRFLNSGAFIGYLSELIALLGDQQVADSDDDQLFFTNIFLDARRRQQHNIKLDHRCQLFQNLHGAHDDVEVRFNSPTDNDNSIVENDDNIIDSDTGAAYLYNHAYDSRPLVVHGNGAAKMALNSLANYLAGGYRAGSPVGCVACHENTLKLTLDESAPLVCLVVVIVQATPFLEEFFERLLSLSYPARRITLLVLNTVEYHDEMASLFVEQNGHHYRGSRLFQRRQMDAATATAFSTAIDQCLASGADYMFLLDSTAHLDNSDTLKQLVEQNRDILAPLLVRPGEAWSNFWGALAEDGFYARSRDYMSIVYNERRSVWNVPYIAHCYLVKRSVLDSHNYRPRYQHDKLDPDMAFCAHMRDAGKYMYVSNMHDFGHLINADTFTTHRLHNELWQIGDNTLDWQRRYIHAQYWDTLQPHARPEMPCPDVFRVPVASERFCRELINSCEHHGKWSSGSNQDERLTGGYENVPTRDIHMKQLGFEREWLQFLQRYVRPLQEKVFAGYSSDTTPPNAIMNFVVRYRPDEQPALRPHNDASTYTVNMALNTPGRDFQGGGARYLRYNCSVLDSQPGWMMLHPGRLTHHHEGLPTTAGTRYIMVSFVDP